MDGVGWDGFGLDDDFGLDGGEGAEIEDIGQDERTRMLMTDAGIQLQTLRGGRTYRPPQQGPLLWQDCRNH